MWRRTLGRPSGGAPLQNPPCSPSCSVCCRKGAGAQDILNVASYQNPPCGGEGRATAPSYVQQHCPRKCFLKDPCVLRPERRLLFLSGGCWFCDSTSKVIARNQKFQNSLSVLSVAHRAELCVRVERTECLPSTFSLQSHLPPTRSTDRNPE